MKLSDSDLWEYINALEGKTVYTKTRGIPSKVLRVTRNWLVIEDKGSVSFKGKAGIFENYNTLIKDDYLIGKSGEYKMMKANLYGRYAIMAILHEALSDETEEIKSGIREV
jgi:hypothetical protein